MRHVGAGRQIRATRQELAYEVKIFGEVKLGPFKEAEHPDLTLNNKVTILGFGA